MIKKYKLLRLINKGLSLSDISKIVKINVTSVRYWLKKYNLKTKYIRYNKIERKYSDDKILEVWNKTKYMNQFLLELGVNPTGGAWYHYKKRLILLGIDVKKSDKNVSAERRNSHSLKRRARLRREGLKKALDLANVPYECSHCKLKNWFDHELILHIHHKNGDCKDNNINNLEYLCPNCHNIKTYRRHITVS
jgi:hypothetical protein